MTTYMIFNWKIGKPVDGFCSSFLTYWNKTNIITVIPCSFFRCSSRLIFWEHCELETWTELRDLWLNSFGNFRFFCYNCVWIDVSIIVRMALCFTLCELLLDSETNLNLPHVSHDTWHFFLKSSPVGPFAWHRCFRYLQLKSTSWHTVSEKKK